MNMQEFENQGYSISIDYVTSQFITADIEPSYIDLDTDNPESNEADLSYKNIFVNSEDIEPDSQRYTIYDKNNKNIAEDLTYRELITKIKLM